MGFLCKWLKTWSPHFKMQKHHMRGRLKQELPYFGANSDPHDQAGGWRCRGWRLKFDVFWFRVRSSTECTHFEWSSHGFGPDARYGQINGNPCKPSALKWKLCIVVWLHFFYVSSQKLHDSYTETAPKYGRSKQGILRMNVLAYRGLHNKILLDSR